MGCLTIGERDEQRRNIREDVERSGNLLPLGSRAIRSTYLLPSVSMSQVTRSWVGYFYPVSLLSHKV